MAEDDDPQISIEVGCIIRSIFQRDSEYELDSGDRDLVSELECSFKGNVDRFFDLFIQICHPCISNQVDSLQQQLSYISQSPSETKLSKIWTSYERLKVINRALNNLFSFPGHSISSSVYTFYAIEFHKSGLLDVLSGCIIELIQDDKLAESKMKCFEDIWKMLEEIGLDYVYVEKQVLDYISEDWGQIENKFETLSAPMYMEHVELTLHEELKRRSVYFGARMIKLIEVRLKEKFIVPHAVSIVDEIFTKYFHEGTLDGMSRLYDLFSGTEAVGDLVDSLTTHITQVGHSRVLEEKDESLVDFLLELGVSLKKLWEENFFQDVSLCGLIQDTLCGLLSLREYHPAQLIMMSLQRNITDTNLNMDELSAILDKVLFLFGSTEGQFVFQKFYSNDLSRRLLFGKCADIDRERLILSKIRDSWSGYMHQSEGMLRDFISSRKVSKDYNDARLPLERETSCLILESEHWPQFCTGDHPLPTDLVDYQNKYDTFLAKDAKQGKIHWNSRLSHCEMTACFPKGEVVLDVSFTQISVLRLFENATIKLTFEEIKNRCNIEDKELKLILHSLSCRKVHVLQKFPDGEEVNPEDQFELNKEYDTSYYCFQENVMEIDVVSALLNRRKVADAIVEICYEELGENVTPESLETAVFKQLNQESNEIISQAFIEERIMIFIERLEKEKEEEMEREKADEERSILEEEEEEEDSWNPFE